jgi:chaperonin cofactor prefoldin
VVDVDKEKVSVPLKTTKESLESLKEKYDKLQQELKHKGII